jgi:hypothetical protein
VIVLPLIRDKEGNDWKIRTYELGQTTLPSFIEFKSDDNVFIVSPSRNNLGTYRIKIDIIDIYGYTNSYLFTIKINKPAEIKE